MIKKRTKINAEIIVCHRNNEQILPDEDKYISEFIKHSILDLNIKVTNKNGFGTYAKIKNVKVLTTIK